MIASRDPLIGHRLWTLALICILLLVSFGFRWLAISSKMIISHDEAISYLAATCHQKSYSDAVQILKPIPTTEWKQYTQIDHVFCFQQISQELAVFDVHPPFYFWLLHCWSLIFGVHEWTGPSLNVFIALVTITILYRFAKDVFNSHLDAILTVGIYAFTINVLVISVDARQYDLLALCTIALIGTVWHLVRRKKSPKLHYYILVFLLTCLGALVHVHFMITISAAIGYAAFYLVNHNRVRLLGITLAIVAGFFFASIIFPIFGVILSKSPGRIEGFKVNEFVARIIAVVFSFRYFYHVFIIIIGLLIIYSFRSYKSGWKGSFRGLLGKDLSGIESTFFVLWIGGGISLLYIGFLTPIHAMGDQYLSMVWPFMAFIPVIVLRNINYRLTVALFLYFVPIIFVLTNIIQMTSLSVSKSIKQFEEVDLLLIDNTARGILIPIIWQIPDNQNVLVGSQEFLKKNSQAWLEYVGERNLYISLEAYSSTEAGRNDILEILKRDGYITIEQGELISNKESKKPIVYEVIDKYAYS